MGIEERLRAFITAELRWTGPPEVLTSDYPLIDRGVLDSLGVLEIAGFVAQAYHIKVNEADLVFENFGCLAAIARYVSAEVTRQHHDSNLRDRATKAESVSSTEGRTS